MNKMFKALLTMMTGTMVITSCQDNDEQLAAVEENQLTFFTLTAYQEGADTRAVIGSKGEDNKTPINWSEGDKLNYFGAGETSDCLILSSGADTPTGTFTGKVTVSDDAYVMYPYQADATFDASNQRITAEVPMTQIATPGTFDPRAALMIGKVKEDGSVQFINAMSYIKVTVPANCYQVTVKAIDRWYTLAGKAVFSLKNEGDWILTWQETPAEEGQAFVRLVSGTESPMTAGTYYIAVLPTTVENGFEIIYNVNNEIYCKQAANKSSTAHTNFYRNKIKGIGTLSTDTGFYTYKVGTMIPAGSNVTLADRNIGASVPCEIGSNKDPATFGDYFQWGALRPCNSFVVENAPYYGVGNKYVTEGQNLDPSDDIAAMLWGGKWRMPTKTELAACLSIKDFRIPKAGRYDGTDRKDTEQGYWWSSTAGINGTSYKPYDNAYCLSSNNSGFMYRYFGACVRPVLGN